MTSVCTRATAAWAARGSAPGAFRTWEVRAAARRAGDVTTLDIDGGLREETADGAARFVVAGGWSALDGHGPAAAEWDAATREVRAGLDELVDETARGLEGLRALVGRCGLVAGPASVEVHVRARAWQGAGTPPAAQVETGVRVRADWSAHGLSGQVDELARSPGELPWFAAPLEFAAALAAAADAEEARAAWPVRDAPWPGGAGPLLFAAEPACWLAHELGHALLETPGHVDLGPALSLRDDPRGAPWPCGFDVDDTGVPGGNARRASVRDAALPFLAATTLAARGGAVAADAAALPVVEDVDLGRFDPLRGAIWLRATSVREGRGRDAVRWRGPVLLRVDPARDLAAAHAVAGETRRVVARCARQGTVLHVRCAAPPLVANARVAG